MSMDIVLAVIIEGDLMRTFNGKVVAITGAGSGLGRELALQFSELGAKLSLCDIDMAALEETKKLCDKNASEDIFLSVVDVSDAKQVHDWADATYEYFNCINMIVNNAGVTHTASIQSISYEDFEWLMSINFWGMIYGTKAFLPYLERSGDGHVVNVSSVMSIVSYSDLAAYCSSKFAIRGFTESLMQELRIAGSQVGVTCVMPGGIRTNLMENGRFGDRLTYQLSDEELKKDFKESLAPSSAKSVASKTINAVRKKKFRLIIGSDAHIFTFVQKLFPVSYHFIYTLLTRMALGHSGRG